MFAPAYMGRKRCFRMLLLHSKTVLTEQLRLRAAKAFEGATPAVFVPRTLMLRRAPLPTFNSRCYRNLDRNLRRGSSKVRRRQRSFAAQGRHGI